MLCVLWLVVLTDRPRDITRCPADQRSWSLRCSHVRLKQGHLQHNVKVNTRKDGFDLDLSTAANSLSRNLNTKAKLKKCLFWSNFLPPLNSSVSWHLNEVPEAVFLPCDKKHLSLKWNIKHKTGLSIKSYQLGTSKAGVFAAEAALFAAILTSLSPDAIRDWKWVVNNNVPDDFPRIQAHRGKQDGGLSRLPGCGDSLDALEC